MTGPAAQGSTLKPAALLFACCLCVYSLTLTRAHLGYEGETIAQAEALLRGDAAIEGRAGLLDVAFYLPFVALDNALAARAKAQSFRHLIPNFALPLEMALAALVVFLAAAEFASRGAAIRAALAFAFATIAWPYAKLGMESTLLLATAMALWGFAREAERPGRGGFVILALALALMLLTKVYAPLGALLWAGAALALLLSGRWRWPPPGALLLCAALAAAGVAVYFWGNYRRFGAPFIGKTYGLSWEVAPPGLAYAPRLAGYLASPGKSLFLFSPALALVPFLLPDFTRRHPWYRTLLLFVVLPGLLFHAWFQTWIDETWGPRRIVYLTPVLALPLALAFEPAPGRGRLRRLAVLLAIAAGALMQLLAVSMNYSSYIYALGPRGLGHEANLAWNPETSQPVFQAQLLASWASRRLNAGSRAVELAPKYLPWNAPAVAPRPERIELRDYDEHLDFWWCTVPGEPRASAWPPGKSTYIAMGLLAGGLLCLGLLLRLPRGEPQPPAA